MPAGNWKRIPGELSLVLTPPCPLSLRAAIYPSQIPRTWITEKRSPNVLIRPRVPHFSNSLNSFRTFLNRFLSESQAGPPIGIGRIIKIDNNIRLVCDDNTGNGSGPAKEFKFRRSTPSIATHKHYMTMRKTQDFQEPGNVIL